MTTSLLLLLLIALSPHHPAKALQHLDPADTPWTFPLSGQIDTPWTFSLSGQMAFRFNHNSTYRYAVCPPPSPHRHVMLEARIEVQPDLLRDADV